MQADSSLNAHEVDWRRIAEERNVSVSVAAELWERSRQSAQDLRVDRIVVYKQLLDDAAADHLGKEPGKDTLALGGDQVRDAASLGPGKVTQVLQAGSGSPTAQAVPGSDKSNPAVGNTAATTKDKDQKSPNEQSADQRETQNPTGKPTPLQVEESLRAVVAGGKSVAAAIGNADQSTLVEALRGLEKTGPAALQQLLSLASGAINRVLDRRVVDENFELVQPIEVRIGKEVLQLRVSPQGAAVLNPGALPVSEHLTAVQGELGDREQPPIPTVRAEIQDLQRVTVQIMALAEQAKGGEAPAKAELSVAVKRLALGLTHVSQQVDDLKANGSLGEQVTTKVVGKAEASVESRTTPAAGGEPRESTLAQQAQAEGGRGGAAVVKATPAAESATEQRPGNA